MNKQQRLNITRAAWDAYQADYMRFNLKDYPDFFERLEKGEVMLDDEVVELAGDVAGLDLLDTSCASDAKQAFSWANLGARVTACDIAPTAIEIARQNALRLGIDVEFHVADAQTLDPISDESRDLVFATYLGWFEDIELAIRTWDRVLRPGGRLLIDMDHPVTNIMESTDNGLTIDWPYFDRSPDLYEFTGTPLASKHGGWDHSMPIYWFHHTLADVLNTIVDTGLRIERVAERPYFPGDAPSELPDAISILARKPTRFRVESLVLSQLESLSRSRERVRACPVLDTGVRASGTTPPTAAPASSAFDSGSSAPACTPTRTARR